MFSKPLLYGLGFMSLVSAGEGVGLWIMSTKLTNCRNDKAVILDRNDTWKKDNANLSVLLGQCNKDKVQLVDDHNREVANYVNFNAQNARAMAPALERLTSLSEYWRVQNQKPVTVTRTGGSCEARLQNIQAALGQHIGRVRDAH
jgi:site-specific recombinase